MYHNLTTDHVELFDVLISEARENRGKFVRRDIKNLSELDWDNALKAAIEYYFYEPIFPESILEILREKGMMHKKRVTLQQEELERFEKQKPRTWDVAE